MDEGLQALGDHGAGLLGHPADQAAIRCAVAQEKGDDLCNILRLIADTLQIGDHLQRGGDLPQIPGHRLLLQEQLQAEGFYASLLLIGLRLQLCYRRRLGNIPLLQRLCGQRDGLGAGLAHLGQLRIQLGQLTVKIASHYPNLPVI